MALVVIQFFPIILNESDYVPQSDFMVENQVPATIKNRLQVSCYDCHSNQTTYPWYSNLAPASFYLEDHIKDGKRHLNFSEWEQYSAKRKDHKLDELIEEVEREGMPLESYTLIHTEAKLDATQTEALINWAKTARINYSGAALPQ